MPLGTGTVPKVEFLAGPGTAFVAEVKRQLFGEMGIDLVADPTEILIVADVEAGPSTAIDLLSQADHGPDSRGVLITDSEEVTKETIRFLDEQLKNLVTAPVVRQAWRNHGEGIVVDVMDERYKFAGKLASEHVHIFKEPEGGVDKMTNYAALFWVEKTCDLMVIRCVPSFSLE